MTNYITVYLVLCRPGLQELDYINNNMNNTMKDNNRLITEGMITDYER
jgi:hypothetical protein